MTDDELAKLYKGRGMGWKRTMARRRINGRTPQQWVTVDQAHRYARTAAVASYVLGLAMGAGCAFLLMAWP